jgi:hypothetical protein
MELVFVKWRRAGFALLLRFFILEPKEAMASSPCGKKGLWTNYGFIAILCVEIK